MTRLYDVFKRKKIFLPVIHPVSVDVALQSVRTAVDAGADGVFLTDQGMSAYEVLRLIPLVHDAFPTLWIGVNLLAFTVDEVMLHTVNLPVRGIWRDNAQIDEQSVDQPRAALFGQACVRHGWQGLYFGGVAFKYQRPVAVQHLVAAACNATEWVDVITTSGPETGVAADVVKVQQMRQGAQSHPMALASGVSVENVHTYLPYVDAFLVASEIETTKYSGVLVPERTRQLANLIHEYDIKKQSDDVAGRVE